MTDLITYEKDTARIQVTVLDDQTGAGKDLTGATYEAFAQAVGSATAIAATVTVTDAEAGIILLSWAAESFTSATYDWQVRITISGETQTVIADQVLVNPSIG